MVLTMDGCLILLRLNQKFYFTTDIFSLLQLCKERICQRGHKIWCEIELSATVIQDEEPPCDCAIHEETPTDIAQYISTCPVH